MDKLNLFPHVFSTTGAIDTANRCRYLFQLKYMEYWNLPERPWNSHLDFGIHFAKAKETVVLSFYKHAMSEHDSIQAGVHYLEDTFAPLYRAAGMDEPVKNPTKAVEMLRRYFEECPLEEGSVPFQLLDYDMSIEKSLLLEIPFKHPETGLPLYISAKYDMLVIEQPADILVITDDKTSGYSAGDTTDKVEATMLKYKLGGQFVQYAVVTNGNPELVYGRRVNHGEVRIVLTSQKAAGAVGKPIQKKQPFVERLHFSITDYHQEEWYIATLDLISELLERYERLKKGDTHAFRKSFGHCISKDVEKYSFRPCEFWQHCTEASYADIEHRYGMQQLVYDKETDTTKTLEERRKELNLI